MKKCNYRMKKIALLLLLIMTLGAANAQNANDVPPAQVMDADEYYNPNGKRVYALLSESPQLFSSKVKVSIDFGQSTSWLGSMSESRLVDKNGKEIKFNSMIDAMNYMSQFGWRFAQAYVVPSGSGGKSSDISVGGTVYWVLCKDVDDYSQISEGFTTKAQQRAR